MLNVFCFKVDASTTQDVFAKYPNKYFIETGSYMGDGIQIALQAGFKTIYSIEISPLFYQYCRQRFAKNPNVILIQGDSSYVLDAILQEVDAPATFWLDGHYSSGNTAKGEVFSPILNELEAIKRHAIKTHTILIDDVRMFGTVQFDFVEIQTIIEKLLDINPNYQIYFEKGMIANDVLVAHIGKK